jgi:hypothetical protein
MRVIDLVRLGNIYIQGGGGVLLQMIRALLNNVLRSQG